jgi:hypothetical protein
MPLAQTPAESVAGFSAMFAVGPQADEQIIACRYGHSEPAEKPSA